MDPKGGFMSIVTFRERYKVNINYLDYHSMLHSIPTEWKEVVKKSVRLENVENVVLKSIIGKEKVCKWVYKAVLERKVIKHNKVETWSNKLGMDIAEDSWKDAFIELRKATCNSVLRSFQYLVLQRAIVTNKFLFMCKIKESDKCYYCGQYTESIEHLFWDCVNVQTLWNEFANSLSQYLDISPYMQRSTALLGTKDNNNAPLLNILFILFKRYIYVQRCKENVISLQGLVVFVKKYYTLDTKTVKINKWDPLMSYFE